jgi:excisionase family DNA binding protein
VSAGAQVKGDGFRRQEEVIRNYCNENGFTGDLVLFRDVASAYTGEHLKKNLGRFIQGAKDRLLRGAHLFIEDMDRFSRLGVWKRNRKLIMSVVEAADYLRMHPKAVLYHIRNENLMADMFGGSYMLRRSDVEEFRNKRATGRYVR